MCPDVGLLKRAPGKLAPNVNSRLRNNTSINAFPTTPTTVCLDEVQRTRYHARGVLFENQRSASSTSTSTENAGSGSAIAHSWFQFHFLRAFSQWVFSGSFGARLKQVWSSASLGQPWAMTTVRAQIQDPDKRGHPHKAEGGRRQAAGGRLEAEVRR
jgi:hypothetical protein